MTAEPGSSPQESRKQTDGAGESTTKQTPSASPPAGAVGASVTSAKDAAVPVIDLMDATYCGARLDESQAQQWARCASIQLREHRPKGPISLAIRPPNGGKATRRRVRCHTITEAMRTTFPANATETINFGACSVATHVASTLLNIDFSSRAREGDGFDFFFHDRAQHPSDYDLFEGTTVIEVSGINEETPTNSVAKRAKEKAEQARSRHAFPSAYAIIVEFSTPQALVVAA